LEFVKSPCTDNAMQPCKGSARVQSNQFVIYIA